MSSVYDGLTGRRPVYQKEYYSGMYQRMPILFDRKFRSYRFTDAECAALCNGEWLEVHGLQNGTVSYGVSGCLQEDIFASVKSEKPIYIFKVKKTLVNNPAYDFNKRKPYYGPNSVQSNAQNDTMSMLKNVLKKGQSEEEKKPKMVLHQPLVDTFSDERDAELAARITAPDLPPVVKVSVPNMSTKLPIFIPVIAGYKFTENGMEMVQDEKSMADSLGVAVKERNDTVIKEQHSVKEEVDEILSDTALVEGIDEMYDNFDEEAVEGFAELNEAAMTENMDATADDMLPFE